MSSVKPIAERSTCCAAAAAVVYHNIGVDAQIWLGVGVRKADAPLT